MNWEVFVEPLRYPFMLRAMAASVAVGITGAVIGSFLLVRRWSLLGDAISHAVLPGVALSYLLGWPYFVGALLTGLLTAVGIGFVERNTRIKSDAAMGILFVGAFALGLAVISRVRTNVDVFHMLFGNVLGVSLTDLALTLGVGAAVVLAVLATFKELQLWAFDPLSAEVMGLPVRALHYLFMLLLSATIVASLRAVGIVLALAMLITPPAAAYLLTHRLSEMMALAACLGALSAVVGLYLSFYLNVASGPAMVLVATLAFAVALLVAPEQGLLARWVNRRRAARQAALDDLLKAMDEMGAGAGPVAVAGVATYTGAPVKAVARRLRLLAREGLVREAGEGGAVELTPAGVQRARQLIRSHRLWERYLTDVGGLPWDAVHSQAHELEHATPPVLAEALARTLGHPTRDPHGSPIPSASGELPQAHAPELPLTALQPGSEAEVLRVDDEDPRLLRRLWGAGVVPGVRVRIKARKDGLLTLSAAVARGGQEMVLSEEEAAGVTVAAVGSPQGEPGRRPAAEAETT